MRAAQCEKRLPLVNKQPCMTAKRRQLLHAGEHC